jgi:hypothetical protein
MPPKSRFPETTSFVRTQSTNWKYSSGIIRRVTAQASVGFLFDWDRIAPYEGGTFRSRSVICHYYFVWANAYRWLECAGKSAIL